ncbi:hypothetical protein BDY24DRAFT_340707 [Mrakia frigida]|uniref:uncharacterized protein n=1 Tax=Mrakia frigida TaxID=29902 RepID=UPI003FCC20DE
MATGAPTILDIFQEIKIDHDNIRDLWTRFGTGGSTTQRLALANTLVREITVHSEAEELTVYPMFKTKGMLEEVKLDQDDHKRITTLIATADSTRLTNPNYDALMKEAVEAFLAHAKEEEEVHLPKLLKQLSEQENTKLTQDFLKARAKVPIHPHTFAPHTGGAAEKVALATGKVQDAVSEAIGGKREYVDVAQQHAVLH